ncbi:MAG: hypothetical protein LBR82_00730 [Desulfovibrio sp.]|jgi:hypothetical protein|nr:hypothetical protein [Desulfovibrio sp.]
MLKVIPTPKGFISTAKRDVYSDNQGPTKGGLTTERLICAAKSVDEEFKKRKLYDALKKSDMYSARDIGDAEQR